MKILIAALIASLSNLFALEYQDLYSKLLNCELKANRSYKIENLIYQKDKISINLKNGEIHIYEKLNNKEIFAVFIGDGEAVLKVDDKASLTNFRNQFELSNPDFSFNNSLILLNSDLLDEIVISSKELDDINYFESNEILEQNIEFYLDQYVKTIDEKMLYKIYDGKNDLFAINFSYDKFSFCIEYSEYEPLEINFYENVPTRADISSYQRRIFALDKLDDISTQYKFKDEYIPFPIDSLKMKIILEDEDLEAKCRAEYYLKNNSGNQNWLFFDLWWEHEIDSIYVDSIKVENYFMENQRGYLSIEVPDNLVDNITLKVWFSGKIVQHRNNYFMTGDDWFPNPRNRDLYPFELEIYHPGIYTIVGNGILDVVEEDSFTNKTVLKSQRELRYPYFEIGIFDRATIDHDGKEFNFYFDREYELEELTQYFLNAYDFYKSIFKRDYFDSYNIVLYDTDFLTGGRGPIDQTYSYSLDNFVFFPVDLAIRFPYYNIGIRFKNCFLSQIRDDSFRDRWLIRGIDSYLDFLFIESDEEMKEDFDFTFRNIHNQFYRFYKDFRTGPISMDTLINNQVSTLQAHLQLKSFKVFHNVRNILYDFNKMNEVQFHSFLSEIIDSEHNMLRESDFLKLMNSYTGENCSWLIEEHIYSDQIPEFFYNYEIKEFDEGYRVILRLKTNSENFKAQIPVLITFQGDNFFASNIILNKKYAQIEFPIFEKEPKKIIINHNDHQIGFFQELDLKDFYD